jgi:hypothetical protein
MTLESTVSLEDTLITQDFPFISESVESDDAWHLCSSSLTSILALITPGYVTAYNSFVPQARVFRGTVHNVGVDMSALGCHIPSVPCCMNIHQRKDRMLLVADADLVCDQASIAR